MRSYAWIMLFQQHYLTLVPGLRFRWHPIGVVEWPPGQGTRGVGILGKLLFSRNWGLKCRGVLVKAKMKIEVRNEVYPPPGCLSQRRKIGTRPCCGDRYCCPIYPPGGRYSGKTLILEIPGGVVNAFVCVDNGLPAALPHASPRLKIPMAPHWCCRVTPRARYPGGRSPEKSLVLEKLGVKVQRGIGEVQNEDWVSKRSLPPPPRAAYPRGLRLGRDPVVVIGIVAPFTPRGVGIPRKLLFSRSRGGGGKCVCMRG